MIAIGGRWGSFQVGIRLGRSVERDGLAQLAYLWRLEAARVKFAS